MKVDSGDEREATTWTVVAWSEVLTQGVRLCSVAVKWWRWTVHTRHSFGTCSVVRCVGAHVRHVHSVALQGCVGWNRWLRVGR